MTKIPPIKPAPRKKCTCGFGSRQPWHWSHCNLVVTPAPSSTGEKECKHSWLQDAPIKVCYHCGFKPTPTNKDEVFSSSAYSATDKSSGGWEKAFTSKFMYGEKWKTVNKGGLPALVTPRQVRTYIYKLLTKEREQVVEEIFDVVGFLVDNRIPPGENYDLLKQELYERENKLLSLKDGGKDK